MTVKKIKKIAITVLLLVTAGGEDAIIVGRICRSPQMFCMSAIFLPPTQTAANSDHGYDYI
jgi:hypothetical protein